MSDPKKPSSPPVPSQGPPPRPPTLPPSVNEAIIAPKRKMQDLKEKARKRLKKYHKKFEKLVRKYFKKLDQKDRYLKFYDLGYRFEAVFSELTSDGLNYEGETLTHKEGEGLVELLKAKLKFPTGENNPDSIGLYAEKNMNEEIQVLQLVAEREEREIKKLSHEIEHAPRRTIES